MKILAVGDAAFKEGCFARILGFREAGKTILFDLPRYAAGAIALRDRAILLDRGIIAADGYPTNVVEAYHVL